MTLVKSSALIIWKWAIMQTPVQSQITSFGLGNFFVNDWD